MQVCLTITTLSATSDWALRLRTLQRCTHYPGDAGLQKTSVAPRPQLHTRYPAAPCSPCDRSHLVGHYNSNAKLVSQTLKSTQK
jgi:hypothetical protein